MLFPRSNRRIGRSIRWPLFYPRGTTSSTRLATSSRRALLGKSLQISFEMMLLWPSLQTFVGRIGVIAHALGKFVGPKKTKTREKENDVFLSLNEGPSRI